jgi:hypothetical protein
LPLTDRRPLTAAAVLIVCRRIDDAALLPDVVSVDGCRAVVASDDPQVHTFCRARFPSIEVCWIERMESFYPVADDVLALTKLVNEWLTELGRHKLGIPAELMPWMQHVEGGATTQRLQDALLLIRSYDALFEEYSVDRVVILGRAPAKFEDDVLAVTARARGVTVVRHQAFGAGSGPRVARRLKAVLGTPYRLLLQSVSIAKVKRLAAARPSHFEFADEAAEGYVFFQLASAAEKHVENIAPLMKALNERGFRAAAVSCFLPAADDRIRARGLRGLDAAEFLPSAAIIAGAVRVFCTVARAALKNARFKKDASLSYRGVPLGRLLWPALSDFLLSELLYRYCLARALQRLFEVYPPVAIKTWGEVSLAEGFVAWQVLRHDRPLMFDYWIGIGIDWPYWRTDNPVDLFLTTGPIQTRRLTSLGVAPQRVVPVGTLRYETLFELKRNASVEDSRKRLAVPSDLDLHIFWNAGAVLRGFNTPREQMTAAKALLDLSAAYRCGLIIKPHVTHTGEALDRVIDSHPAAPHVVRVTGAELPYVAMHASDVVVTKTSTIGLEAMLLERPVVFLALDGEPKWRAAYEDAVEYVHSLDELDDLFRMLVDAGRRKTWMLGRLAAQERYLRDYFCSTDTRPELLAAETIASRIVA